MSKASVARADRPSRFQLMAAPLDGLPLPGRWALLGAAFGGAIGAVAGLAIGLIVYSPTAPFAAVELGLPATIIGAVIGLGSGYIVIAGRLIRRRPWFGARMHSSGKASNSCRSAS